MLIRFHIIQPRVLGLVFTVALCTATGVSAQGLIFSSDFESGRLCVWSSHDCDPADLIGLPGFYEQQASDLIQGSACVPPSSDTDLMSRVVAMALLQQAIQERGLYSPFVETYPSDDGDLDGFSSLPDPEPATLRAKDCNDADASAHPLILTDGGADDRNCNGIFGIDPGAGVPYEELLCEPYDDVDRLLVFGDSSASGFDMDTSCLAGDFATCMENGLDSLYNFAWRSFTTGTDVTNSLHLELFQRNHCAHRQWMNLAVPDDEILHFGRQVSRLAVPAAETGPSMVAVFFGLGDLCRDALEDMTAPDGFHTRLTQGLEELDPRLAPGSVVFLLGLPSFDENISSVENQIHPTSPDAGSPDAFTYLDLYDYLNCLEASSCPIITTGDPGSRVVVNMRANEFDAVIIAIMQTQQFTNFDVKYIDSTEIYSEAADAMANAGLDPMLLFAGFDGLHPKLEYSSFVAQAMFDIIETRYPEFLNEVNPNNATIEALFGNQGGN